MKMIRRKETLSAVVLVLWLAVLSAGCTVTVPYEDRAIKENLLDNAGFWPVDTGTPDGRSLLDSTPRGQFVSYQVEGSKYYVYAGPSGRTVYLGNEAAYQKYLAMVRDKKLCQSLDATDWGPFWACFQEYQKSGANK